jgi:phage-related protein
MWLYLIFDIVLGMKNWSVETLGKLVDDELEQLPLDMRGRFVRVASLMEAFGPFNVGLPHIRSLGEKLWEIRVSGRDGIGRGIYVVATDKRVVVVHVFVKKTQKTPAAALEIALRRAKESGLL